MGDRNLGVVDTCLEAGYCEGANGVFVHFYTALVAHLMEDEEGALTFEGAEGICDVVAAHVGPARFREGYPFR